MKVLALLSMPLTRRVSRNVLLILIVAMVTFPSQAQRKKRGAPTAPAATLAPDRWQGYEQRKSLEDNSLVRNIEFRNVGPTVMSGRVVDLEVNPEDPSHFYVAYASGGLWETKNEGASFEPIFDNEIVMSIGDIAVDWTNKVIYLGSGENNASRSSYSGYGLFKSANNGETWEHIGLEESHHIGRIIIHPENPNVIWVGAAGRLYSENAERGLYKSTDGGTTWTRKLFVDDRTGIIELVINPDNPDELIAAAWEKDRKAWNFVEAGPGSGLYKSTDGGETWNNISEGDSGFPDTDGMGRVGLSYAPGNVVFAILDNQDRREPDEDDEEFAVNKEQLRGMTNEEFLALNNTDLNDFLDRRYFPSEYNAVDIKEDVRNGKVKPQDLVAYVEDANSLLFDTSVKGAEVYKSTDGGNSWVKTHEGYIESVINTYGYYFGQIRHNPSNLDQLYVLGVPIIASDDGGKNWKSLSAANVHSDHHALWINPENAGHLILGNDGGINISKDDGETWIKCNSPAVGQFYYVTVDMAEPYNVYGGLQDNGVWKGPSTYRYSDRWHSGGKYPYQSLMGGDGMQVQVDNRDNSTVYTGFQFGNYWRIDTKTGNRQRITPRHKLGESPYRWNWQSPILLSPHNQDIVYFGSNRFHRSMNQGDDFETMSGDLTTGGKTGDVSYGTLTTISESPKQFGLIYVGSDDGLIHVSKDAGTSWTQISGGLPADYWISRMEASSHQLERVYASLNGYRWDNFDALIYVSENYGATWTKLGGDLPKEPVNVIREDPANENVLYVGTDHGAYVSLDRGQSFMAIGSMPNTPVHDLVVHPRENDLIVGTHGRSIYIGDISLVQQLTNEIIAKPLHFFDAPAITYSSRWGSGRTWGEPREPELTMSIYAGSAAKATIQIMQEELEINNWEVDIDRGLNFVKYNLAVASERTEAYGETLEDQVKEDFEAGDNDVTYLRPGSFKVVITSGSNSIEGTFKVKAPRERKKRKGS